jgi:hypothetical protein
MVRLVRHRQTKGPATDRSHLNHRATSRLYLRRDKPGRWRIAEVIFRAFVMTLDAHR